MSARHDIHAGIHAAIAKRASAKQVSHVKSASALWVNALWAGALSSLACVVIGALTGREAPYPQAWLFGALSFAGLFETRGFAFALLGVAGGVDGGIVFSELLTRAPALATLAAAGLVALPFAVAARDITTGIAVFVATWGAAILTLTIPIVFESHGLFRALLPPAGATILAGVVSGFLFSFRELPFSCVKTRAG